MYNLDVEWDSVSHQHLWGSAKLPTGESVKVVVHRWHPIGGAAVVQVRLFPDIPDADVLPLPDCLLPLDGIHLGLNHCDCGVLDSQPIAPDVHSSDRRDTYVLQSVIGVVNSDDLFVSAGQMKWRAPYVQRKKEAV